MEEEFADSCNGSYVALPQTSVATRELQSLPACISRPTNITDFQHTKSGPKTTSRKARTKVNQGSDTLNKGGSLA